MKTKQTVKIVERTQPMSSTKFSIIVVLMAIGTSVMMFGVFS